MASFDYVYVAAEKGQEHEVLAALKLHVAQLYGDYALRTRRGSGWVQLQLLGNQYERELEFSEAMQLLSDYPDQRAAGEAEHCRELSRALGVDVVRVFAVTSVGGVEFTRCRGGEVVRHFLYSPEDEKLQDGWGEEVGSPEAWEKPHGPIDATDIGKALGLPGLERAYLPGEGERAAVFDRELQVVGQRKPLPAGLRAAPLDLPAPALPSPRLVLFVVTGIVALLTWLVRRRWLAPSSK